MPSVITEQASRQRRLFFALWPEPSFRAELKQQLMPLLKPYAKDRPVRQVPIRNWHITLAFIGNVTEATCIQMQQQVDAMSLPREFECQLDCFGYFRQARVAWLGCTEVAPELQSLVLNLNQALQPCGYTPDYSVYRPHMTLLRKARRAIQPAKPVCIGWKVTEICLIESTLRESGAHYAAIRRWPLDA